MGQYTTSALISEHLKRALTAEEEALISVFLPGVKLWIDKKLSSTFDKVDESTRYYDGGEYSVDIDPCTAITAISSIDRYGTSLYDYLATDYQAEPINETVKRELRKRDACWPHGIGNVKVTAKFSEYDNGVPQDIQTIATIILSDLINASSAASTSNIASESLEGHSVTYRDQTTQITDIAMSNETVKSMLDLRKQILVG